MTETFQLSAEAAEAYEAQFVPSFFAQWAPRLLDAAGVAAGQDVLDVACGTGIVARGAAERVGPDGSVTGVDRSEEMLAVARRVRPDLRWRHGDAAALPFGDREFDAVVCQMAMMFFPDPVARCARCAGWPARRARSGSWSRERCPRTDRTSCSSTW
ncbi:MAG TPA: class I SAM-dependent methyltransferase [Micromonosporaceae bacterium]|nr:class I SAM-dependent methyltransferase [Micromonosporaceae bacterium]